MPDAPLTLLDRLFLLRDRQRALRSQARKVIRGETLPWELNRQGLMRWYLHPAIEDTALRTLIVFLQQLPPGGRSGIQLVQGGVVIFVLQGRGYTVMDGVPYHWESEDLIQLPLRPDGVTYQHFNVDLEQPALLFHCQPNFVEALGVDRGSGFEQVEDAPSGGPHESA